MLERERREERGRGIEREYASYVGMYLVRDQLHLLNYLVFVSFP